MLEGQTVHTISHGLPRIINRVTENGIEIRGRKTTISRGAVERAYRTLLDEGELIVGQTEYFLLYLIPALINAAFPHETSLVKIDGVGIRKNI